MHSYRWPILISALCFASISLAQVDPDQGQEGPRATAPISRDEQRRKFHPTPVKGTLADDWLKGYQLHLKMESDSPFQGISWRSVGPEKQSGRVNVILAPVGDPGKLYVAFATGGLYRTDNDGESWTSLFDNQ